jgi:dipeptide/tripeptide permease
LSATDPSRSEPARDDLDDPAYGSPQQAVHPPESAAPTLAGGHPTGFWFFFWGEFAERASFYGMRAILYLYMTEQLLFEATTAGPLYSCFKFACYLTPLLGGYLADRYFGRYWTIVGFSVPYVLAQIVLGFESQITLLFALILLAFGSGVIKPNISSLMGQTYDQQRPGNINLRANAFLWFYFAINVGSTLSYLLLPIVRNKFGYQVAFAIPAVLMAGALLVFALGKKHYATETIGPPPSRTPEERAQQRKVLNGLFGIFALMVFFWVVYEHNDILWVQFAKDRLNLTLPGWLGGATLSADQFGFINAALILVFIPFFQWFWPKVDPTGRRFPHTYKIFVGFFCTATAPALLAVAGFLSAGDTRVSMVWIMAAFFFLTLGEVLIYGTGLDLSYGYAPASMKGFVTACFLLTIAIGNAINIFFTGLYKSDDPNSKGLISPEYYFALDAALVLGAGVAFYFVGKKFNQAHSMAA